MSKTVKHAFIGNRITIDIAADARAFEGGINGYLVTLGKLSVNDGLAREYYWNPASVQADDGDNVLKPTDTAGAGRWIKIIKAEGLVAATGRISGDGINDTYQVTHNMGSINVTVQVIDGNGVNATVDSIQRFSNYVEITFPSVVGGGTIYDVLMIFLGV